VREPTSFTHEEYQLTKVALERSDVPAEALALLSAWIEGEDLLLYRDAEEGWKLLCMGRDTAYAQFVPVFAARSRAVEEIKRQLSKDQGDVQK
jgi:hypothetical protein